MKVILNQSELFPRQCSVTGEGMRQGYCFNDGCDYAKDEATAKQWVETQGMNWQTELDKIDTPNEWFYWTEWEELDSDINYDVIGRTFCKHHSGEWVLTPVNADKINVGFDASRAAQSKPCFFVNFTVNGSGYYFFTRMRSFAESLKVRLDKGNDVELIVNLADNQNG